MLSELIHLLLLAGVGVFCLFGVGVLVQLSQQGNARKGVSGVAMHDHHEAGRPD